MEGASDRRSSITSILVPGFYYIIRRLSLSILCKIASDRRLSAAIYA